MVSKEEWTVNRREKLEVTISAHLSHQPEGRLAIGIRSLLNPLGASPRAVRVAAPFTPESLDRLINKLATALAADDWTRVASTENVRDEEAIINDASEMVVTAISTGRDEKKERAR
jgi:hypothetical protein